MTVGVRKPGEFCWINMLSPDTSKAREFFAGVLEWTYVEMPGMGHLIQVGGKDIGGLFDVKNPGTGEVHMPIIGVMVKVASVDATCEKVKASGGDVKMAFDIADRLRMAVCHDPNGANFDLMEPRTAHGTEVDTAAHGAPSWFETLTTDTAKAGAFYTKVFGWRADKMPGVDWEYFELKLDEKAIAGMMKITPQMQGMRPMWGVYFTVRSADAAQAAAAKLGGTVHIPVTPIPGVGKFACIVSPGGVMFYVIEYVR